MILIPNYDATLPLAREVAGLLPDPYEVQTVECDRNRLVLMVHGDERVALLHRSWAERNNNYVSFIGLPLECDPTDSTSVDIHTKTAKYTSVWRLRDIAKITHQVRTRLLPSYRAELAKERDNLAARQARTHAVHERAAYLAELLPNGRHVPARQDSLYAGDLILFGSQDGGPRGRLGVRHGRNGLSYTLNFGEQPPAFLAAVLDLIRSHFTPEGGRRNYTVTGLRREDSGELLVSSVLLGQHDAQDSECNSGEFERYATSVWALDADEAEELAHREIRGDDEDEDEEEVAP